MISLSKEEFEEMVSKAVAQLPKTYLDRLSNVAILVEDEPNQEERYRLGLQPNQTLYGLYEGVPLSQRQGGLKMLPDKITIYQKPLQYSSNTKEELFERLGRTIWHEVAHYFGLGHDRISELEEKEKGIKPE